MDVWPWICELPNSNQWTESDPPHVFELATDHHQSTDTSAPTRSIQLRASRATVDSPLVTFTICLQGFGHVSSEDVILWASDTCDLASDKPFLPLVVQLLQETISRAPTAQDSTSPKCPRSQLEKLKPEVVSWIMDSHSPESFSAFFCLALLTRLFWLCAAAPAPSDAGSLFFLLLLSPALDGGASPEPRLASPALRTFFATAGVDAELCFMRTVGYMLAKWCILRDALSLTPKLSTSLRNCSRPTLGFSFAGEAHGFWTLKGYAPVPGMKLTRRPSTTPGGTTVCSSAEDLVLKYTLAHQQLEAVIQLEYTVVFYEGFIQVNARVDNFRLRVVKLGYRNDADDKDAEDDLAGFGDERHFPSRVRAWVGPEVGANYVAGLSLGRSTENAEAEVERTEGKSKGRRTRTRAKRKSWRWDQDAEGNAAVFEAVLCDRSTGREVATAARGGGGGEGMRGRYDGAERVFTKSGGVVLGGDEYGEGVGWRIGKEMEGSVLKWRIGCKVWVSYFPNQVDSSLFETRFVEWCDEVDLPLIPAKLLTF